VGANGDATDRNDGEPPRDKLATAVLRTQAKEALSGLGRKPALAVRAVNAAINALGSDASLERVIFESLKRCPRPEASGARDLQCRIDDEAHVT
jgi:hypothetical protein